jgi:hypothetical protein
VVLEIGVKHGESLKLWEEYFPNAMIYGIDVREYSKECETDRIKVFIGDQGDGDFLDKVLEEMVGPPNIVIDDGSHWPPHQLFGLNHFFPHLAPGGIYIIEDIQSSYGTSRHRAYHLRHEGGAIEFLKGLVDDVNYPWHRQEFSIFTHYIKALHFYLNLVVVLKKEESEMIIRPFDTILQLIVENEIKTAIHLGAGNIRLCKAILAPYGVRKNIDEYWAVDPWENALHYKQAIGMKSWAFNLHVLKAPLLEASDYFWRRKKFQLIFLELPPDYNLVKTMIQKWKPFLERGGFFAGYGYGRLRWEGLAKAVDEELGEVEEHPMSTWTKKL